MKTTTFAMIKAVCFASCVLACVGSVSAASIIYFKLGSSSWEIYPIVILVMVPFALSAMIAYLTRHNRLMSSVIFLTIFLIVIDEFFGIYQAFYRNPAKGGFAVIYRPIFQTGLVVAIGSIALFLKLIKKLK